MVFLPEYFYQFLYSLSSLIYTNNLKISKFKKVGSYYEKITALFTEVFYEMNTFFLTFLEAKTYF